MIFCILLWLSSLYYCCLFEAGTVLWNIVVVDKAKTTLWFHPSKCIKRSCRYRRQGPGGRGDSKPALCNIICICGDIETDIQIFSWSSSFAYRMQGNKGNMPQCSSIFHVTHCHACFFNCSMMQHAWMISFRISSIGSKSTPLEAHQRHHLW